MGSAYLRYSFTKGTVQEIDHVAAALGLRAGERVLDVGCGPGRHAHELARRGVLVHGVDISAPFVDLARAAAPDGATFQRLDARALPFRAEFDAAICLCQGAFGLMTATGDDTTVAARIAAALRPGGRLALSAFNAYFAVRFQTDAQFDAATGVMHEHTEVRDPQGAPLEVELWTGCYTPRELRLLLADCGLTVERISSVEPGAYGDDPPTTESPEFLVIARKR
ncbi:MAG: class I SAM-dependent methyltransferase [Acidimicrobiia bacterium]|nr:class I SAM-dependent methyltransferase [Acidimicrobiia bacterium]